MNVTISSKTTSVDEATRAEIRDQVYFVLSRYSPRIDQVAVRVGGVGGMDGDQRRLCRLSVRIKPMGSFLVECVEDNLESAVSRAAERAARRLDRMFDVERDQRRLA